MGCFGKNSCTDGNFQALTVKFQVMEIFQENTVQKFWKTYLKGVNKIFSLQLLLQKYRYPVSTNEIAPPRSIDGNPTFDLEQCAEYALNEKQTT
jgi:hypothetical protein